MVENLLNFRHASLINSLKINSLKVNTLKVNTLKVNYFILKASSFARKPLIISFMIYTECPFII